MTVQPGFHALDAHRSHLDSVRENASRLASCYASYVSTGWGEYRCPDAVRFTTIFVGRPSVAVGWTVDNDSLKEGRYPRITAGVSRWLTDNKGLYIGAWLWFVVDTVPPPYGPTLVVSTPIAAPTTIDYEIIHDFTFTGVAMKSIPAVY